MNKQTYLRHLIRKEINKITEVKGSSIRPEVILNSPKVKFLTSSINNILNSLKLKSKIKLDIDVNMASKDKFMAHSYENQSIVYITPVLRGDDNNSLHILYLVEDNKYVISYNQDEKMYKDLDRALDAIENILSDKIVTITKLKWDR